jgi:hypothetical protein
MKLKGGDMHVFAILLLLGLGTLALVMLAERYLMAMRRELWAVSAVAVGIALAWFADLDAWGLWGLPVRAEWIGVTLTGLLLGGLAHFWHEILGFFSGLVRKYNDEAAAIEKTQDLRRVA